MTLLVSEDRGLMARTFGGLGAVAVVMGALILAVGDDSMRDQTVVAVIVAVELIISSICFVGGARLPVWFFHVALLAASVLICLNAAVENKHEVGVLSLYVVWVVLVANLFFGFRSALAHSLLVSSAFAAVLVARDVPFAANFAVATFTLIGAAGLVVGLLSTRLERIASQLDLDAKTDSVTQLANRRGFNEHCDREIARAARDRRSLSLILCDMDFFKRVNDQFGHDQGDLALRAAANAIRGSVRGIDVVGRLGGEEFGIVLPGADQSAAMVVADRIRESVREAFADHPVSLTVSCGVATLSEKAARREALLRAADEALYEAKGLGRDRSVAAPATGRRIRLVPA
jgi:diguanylate cyclase (GGDEF)-like protein